MSRHEPQPDGHENRRRRRGFHRRSEGESGRPPRQSDRSPAESGRVTDDDALKALLASASERKRQREEEQRKGGRRRDGDRPRDSRRADPTAGDTDAERRDKRRRSSTERSSAHVGKARQDLSYYGRAADEKAAEHDDDAKPKEKANFGLSGALARDEGGGGNVYKGVVLKFQEPPEARAPNTQWRFYVFKAGQVVETLHVSRQSAYLIGRNRDIADIPMYHGSLSGQHAVLQYRAMPTEADPTRLSCQPYIMDLESTNGTFLNGVRIDPARYYQLKRGDVLTFGASTREYVLMTENTTSVKS